MKEYAKRLPGGAATLVIGILALVVALTGTAVATTGLVTVAGTSGNKAQVTSASSLVTSERDPTNKHYAHVNASGQALVTGPVTSADRTVVLASGSTNVPSGPAPVQTAVINTAGYREIRVDASTLDFAAGDEVVAWADGNPGVGAYFVLGAWLYSNAGENAPNAGNVSQVIETPGPKTYLTFTNTSGAQETVWWQVVGRSN